MRWLGVARRALDMRAGRTEPPGMAEEVRPALERLERRAGKRLGDASEPLLVSVRSGARESMPGMLDTSASPSPTRRGDAG
jgi:Pyruvate phosphate dikinase, AMP/ATP-binding domain